MCKVLQSCTLSSLKQLMVQVCRLTFDKQLASNVPRYQLLIIEERLIDGSTEEERVGAWKKHFEGLIGQPPTVTKVLKDLPMKKITCPISYR